MTLYLVIMDDGDQGDPECSYLEDGVDTAQEAGDHRRQMMQFCGQHPACTRSLEVPTNLWLKFHIHGEGPYK